MRSLPNQVHVIVAKLFEARGNYDQAKECEIEAYAGFARGLLERGVYPPASQFEAWFPSLAHTEEHVEQTIEAAKAALSEL